MLKPDSPFRAGDQAFSGAAPAGAALKNGWDFFDAVYCISLSDRPDRRESAKAAFREVGLLERVLFMTVARDGADSERGIFTSHMKCLQQGLAQGAETILVFEDDVVFEGFSKERLDRAVQYLGQLEKWDAFFLGCMVRGVRKTACPDVVRVRYRSLAHAFAVRRPFARALVREQWNGTPFDVLLRTAGRETFCLYPPVAFQSDAATDNFAHARLDRFRRALGGLKTLQKVNMRFHCHKAGILALHLLVAAMLAYLLS